ncbi:M20/M25/M40 family metallo-hydrolase, partial [Xanthomonas sp. Kuri4-1]
AASTPAAPAPEAAAAAPASKHAFSADITPDDFGELVKTLSSDAFEGRGPGTPGEEKTVTYIRDQMQRIGLQPGNGDSWFQDVPMVETTADPHTTPRLESAGKTRDLAFGTDIVVGTRTAQPEVRVDSSELVFVGYGVDAPEQKWNDYAGQDWKGKTVVMFVNDPGFHTHDAKLFDGTRMTYYGRWTYKFEEAARKGAAAALIVHDSAGASYGWDVVKNSWAGAQYDLPAQDDPAPRLPVQGWLSAEAARQLFADAGLDLDQAYKDASKRGFKPVPLKAKWSVDLKSTIAQKQSRNVVGVLPGSSRADEAVLYMAHWDHLGKHDGEPGDNIYNGAVDNATGVAGILEIADAFAHQEPRPARSVVFLAVTLEESGLLGSQYYVAHPSFPLDKIAGVINLDAMSVAGRARDITVVGSGSSELEDLLKPVAARQGRVLHGERRRRTAPTSARTTSTSPRPACRRCTPTGARTCARAAPRPGARPPRPTASTARAWASACPRSTSAAPSWCRGCRWCCRPTSVRARHRAEGRHERGRRRPQPPDGGQGPALRRGDRRRARGQRRGSRARPRARRRRPPPLIAALPATTARPQAGVCVEAPADPEPPWPIPAPCCTPSPPASASCCSTGCGAWRCSASCL